MSSEESGSVVLSSLLQSMMAAAWLPFLFGVYLSLECLDLFKEELERLHRKEVFSEASNEPFPTNVVDIRRKTG